MPRLTFQSCYLLIATLSPTPPKIDHSFSSIYNPISQLNTAQGSVITAVDDGTLHSLWKFTWTPPPGGCGGACIVALLVKKLGENYLPHLASIISFLSKERAKKKNIKKSKHTTIGIRWWSPTQLLIDRSENSVGRADGIPFLTQSMVVCTVSAFI